VDGSLLAPGTQRRGDGEIASAGRAAMDGVRGESSGARQRGMLRLIFEPSQSEHRVESAANGRRTLIAILVGGVIGANRRL
jgi:hypothetical protein